MIKRFHKKLNNGLLAIDFHKVKAEGFPINILITERGEIGKTHNSKEFAIDEYLKYGVKSAWVLNSATQIDEDKSQFLVNNKAVDYEKKWEDVKIVNDSVIKDGNEFMKLVALSTSESKKGSRDYRIKNIIYDEFNVGLDKIKTKQVFLFENLLATFKDVKKIIDHKMTVFIFGNNKSINTPLLVAWKIFEIKEELTKIYDEYGNPLIMIYTPEIDQNLLEEKNKDDFTYQLAKRSGTADYIFHNMSIYDNINGIKRLADEDLQRIGAKITTHYTLDGNTFILYNFIYENKTHFFLAHSKVNGDDSFVVKKQDMEVGRKFNPEARDKFLQLIIESRIWFDSISSKMSLLSCL